MALQTLPVLLLGPYGGVIADRVDKRRLMVVLQSDDGPAGAGARRAHGHRRGAASGRSACSRCCSASTTPSRTPHASRSCSRWSAPSTCATRSASTRCSVNVARAIGPAVAGMLIATVGEGVCFLVNAASFVAVVVSLMTLDLRGAQPTPPTARGPGQLREGLRYIRGTRELAIPLLMMALVGMLAYEFQVTLPVMARQGLHVGRRRAMAS